MTIPKTFCPAKWDDIYVNLNVNYAYACCRSAPVKFVSKTDIFDALNTQKNNLLNNVQDPACEYCWKLENQGFNSLRHDYLSVFDASKFEEYKNNTVRPKTIEINIGNECNFQCNYCNPKFSSQWETDVRQKPYKIFSDKDFYSIDEKNQDNIANTIEWLADIKSIELLKIIGGEPLYNKNFFRIINTIKSDRLAFHTNLSCKRATLDKVIALASNYKEIIIGVSIDSTGANAEFTRYGMDYAAMVDNLNYLIDNVPENIKIEITSLMTSVTVRDIVNMSELVEQLYNKNPKLIHWEITYCRDPSILSMNTLPDQYKDKIISAISLLKDKRYIRGVDRLESDIRSSVFNKTLYGQLKHFLEEFSSRKNIKIPVIMD